MVLLGASVDQQPRSASGGVDAQRPVAGAAPRRNLSEVLAAPFDYGLMITALCRGQVAQCGRVRESQHASPRSAAT